MIGRLLITGCISFNTVESIEWKLLFETLDPKLTLKSR